MKESPDSQASLHNKEGEIIATFTRRVDARLAAKAPDMLDALERIIWNYENPVLHSGEYSAAMINAFEIAKRVVKEARNIV